MDKLDKLIFQNQLKNMDLKSLELDYWVFKMATLFVFDEEIQNQIIRNNSEKVNMIIKEIRRRKLQEIINNNGLQKNRNRNI